jgi:hypothetical protein
MVISKCSFFLENPLISSQSFNVLASFRALSTAFIDFYAVVFFDKAQALAGPKV